MASRRKFEDEIDFHYAKFKLKRRNRTFSNKSKDGKENYVINFYFMYIIKI